MSGAIRIDRGEQLATVWIDNPQRHNAITQAMWIELGDAFQALSQDAQLRCIVIRGAGDAAFGSGADISEFAAIRATAEQARRFSEHTHRAMHAGRDCPMPVLAAIRGVCVGGALEMAAFCDLRIASDDSRFGVPIARLGAVLAYPEMEGLVRLAGPSGALEVVLEGRIFGAAEALSKGIVNRVVPVARFDAEIEEATQRICAGAPLSARWHKRFVAKLRKGEPLTPADIEEGYACYETEDYRIGFTTFLDKRVPEFVGR
jgi:enoyl-CoA hydratase/carnithine racemase